MLENIKYNSRNLLAATGTPDAAEGQYTNWTKRMTDR
jgi:hypothetical protein